MSAKGPPKRQRADFVSENPYAEEFRGCRDSPSPTRPGGAQRASKSQPMHHRILLETPLMHRHELEWQLEELWDNHGVEYKFLRSSGDMSTLNFYGGLSSSAASSTGPSSTASAHAVTIVPPTSTSASRALPAISVSASNVVTHVVSEHASQPPSP